MYNELHEFNVWRTKVTSLWLSRMINIQTETVCQGHKICFNLIKFKYVNYFTSFEKLYKEISVNNICEIFSVA